MQAVPSGPSSPVVTSAGTEFGPVIWNVAPDSNFGGVSVEALVILIAPVCCWLTYVHVTTSPAAPSVIVDVVPLPLPVELALEDVHVGVLAPKPLGGPVSVTVYGPSGTEVHVWVFAAESVIEFPLSSSVNSGRS